MRNEINVNTAEIEKAIAEFDLNHGNGLNIWPNESDPGEHCLFIGLGGTGVHTLMRLKRLVTQKYNNFKQKFTFLGIDTTSAVRELYPLKDYLALDAKSEKLIISVENVARFFHAKNEMSPYVKEFLNDSTSHNGDEAGKKRQVGRALFFANVVDIKKAIDNAVVNLFEKGAIRGQIYIFTGLGGGTGSGIFLDTAFLLRQKLIEEHRNAKIFGFFVLPDVHATIKDLSSDNTIWAGSFAALKEIDYWMCSEERGDAFVCNYNSNITVDLKEAGNKKPFDYIFPLMARTSNGVQVPNAYTTVIKIISEIVCGFASYEDGNAFFNALQANLDDTSQHVKHSYYMKSANENHELYPHSFINIAIGASVLKMPFNELATYLLGEIMNKIKFHKEINEETLRKRVLSVCEEIKLPITLLKNSVDLKVNTKVKKPILKAKETEEIIKIYGDYSETVKDKISEIILEIKDEIIISLIGDKDDNGTGKLLEIFSDIDDFGPDFLRKFLSDEHLGLLQNLLHLKKDANDKLKKCEEQSRILLAKYDYEKRAFDDAIGFLRDSYWETFVEGVKRYFQNEIDKVIYNKMGSLYDTLYNELMTRYQAVGQYSAHIISKTKDALANNEHYFTTISDEEYRFFNDLYRAKEMAELIEDELHSEFADKKDERMKKCAKFILENLYKTIYKTLSVSAGDKSWYGFTITSKLFDINNFYKKYISDTIYRGTNMAELFYKFEDSGAAVRKTFGYYVEKKAENIENKPIKDFLKDKIEELASRSDVVFHGCNNEATSKYLIYPIENTLIGIRGENATDDSIEKIADKTSAIARPTVESGIAKDSMIFIQMKMAVPFFESVSMSEISTINKYNNAPEGVRHSLHLVSSSEFTSKKYLAEYNDWLNLPSFIPKSRMSESEVVTLSVKEQKLSKLFDSYLEQSLIHYDENAQKISYKFFEIKDFDKNGEYSINNKRPATIVLEDLRQKYFKTNSLITEIATPAKELNLYLEKLNQLIGFITSTREIDENKLISDYTDRLYCIERSFSCLNHFKPHEEYRFSEGKTLFTNSLNLQRDLNWMCDFLIDVKNEINTITSARKTVDIFVKSSICGYFGYINRSEIAFYQNGKASLVPINSENLNYTIVGTVTEDFILTQIFNTINCNENMINITTIDNMFKKLSNEGGFLKETIVFLHNLYSLQINCLNNITSEGRSQFITELFNDSIDNYEKKITNLYVGG